MLITFPSGRCEREAGESLGLERFLDKLQARATALQPQASFATGVLQLGLSQQGSSCSPVPTAISGGSYIIAPVLCAAKHFCTGVDGVLSRAKTEQAESAQGKRAWSCAAFSSFPRALAVCSASPGGCDIGEASICDTYVPGMGHSVPAQSGEVMDI